jgi:hypothetical protein
MLNSVQEGFVKQAAQHGIDENLLRACLKVAAESQALMEQTIKKAEAMIGGSNFRRELYHALCKKADISSYIQPLQQGLMKHLGVGSDAANAILGSGGGALAGLLGSQVVGTDPLASLLFGATGGAGLGYGLGRYAGGTSVKTPQEPAAATGSPTPDAGSNFPLLKTLGFGAGLAGGYKYRGKLGQLFNFLAKRFKPKTLKTLRLTEPAIDI